MSQISARRSLLLTPNTAEEIFEDYHPKNSKLIEFSLQYKNMIPNPLDFVVVHGVKGKKIEKNSLIIFAIIFFKCVMKTLI